MKYRYAEIIFPVQEYIVRRFARRGESMSGVAADPTPHQKSIGTAAGGAGFTVVTVMTVRYPDWNSFEAGAAKQQTGKCMDVAVNYIILAIVQNFSKATAKAPKVLRSRAAKDIDAQFFYFWSI
jgi:hypothetical protein